MQGDGRVGDACCSGRQRIRDCPVLCRCIKKPGNYVVRVTFQRVVTRTDNSIYVETIKDQDIYQEFFEKLPKSVFIEAQQV